MNKVIATNPSELKLKNAVDIIITLMIILIADNPIVVGNKFVSLVFFGFLSFVFIYRKRKLDIQLLWVVLANLLIIRYYSAAKLTIDCE